MGRITKNYIYNVVYQLLVIITPIITAPYLSRVLGANNLGIYSYVYSSGSIITTISLLGIYTYGNRQTAYVRENKTELTQTFWELEIVRLFLGVLGSIVYFIYIRLNRDYSLYFFLFFPYIIAQFIDCSWIYVGLEDMKPAVIKNFVTKVINILGIFAFVNDKDDVWIYIFMLAITTLLANISVYSQLKKYISGPNSVEKIELKTLLNHIKGSLFLFLPQVASLLYLQVDKVMIEWITGTTSQVAFYDQAEKIINIPLALITVLSTVMMPRIANEYKKNHIDNITELIIKSGRFSLMLACPMMIGLLVIARQFIPWYLGNDFLSTASALMILAPIVVFNSLASISGTQYFTASNQIEILIKAYCTAAVLNVIVNAILIPQYGYVGTAVATVVSSFISVVIQYYYFLRQINCGVILKYCFSYLLGSIIMGISVFALTYKYSAKAIITFTQILIGVVVYFIYLFIIKDDLFQEILHKEKCKKHTDEFV